MDISFHAVDKLPDEVVEFWTKRRLEQDPLACFTTGHEWFAMMAEGNDPPATVGVVRGPSGEAIALAPLLFREEGLAAPLFGDRFGTGMLRTARVFGGDLLCDDGNSQSLVELLREIFAHHPETAAMRLDHVASGARTALVLDGCTPENGVFPAWEFRAMPHYRLELPETFEKCCAIRSGKSIKQIRRHARRLGDALGAELTVDELCEASELEERAGDVERLVDRAWQARVLGHRLNMGDVVRLSRRGWVRLFLLRGGSKAVAFVLCYRNGDSLIREQSGYDPEWARHYPGEILLYMMLQRLYEGDRPRVIDFGVGEGYHKRMFANNRIEISGLWLVRDTGENRARFRRYAVASAIDRCGRRLLERTGLKRMVMRGIRRKPTPHPGPLAGE